jgi:hypothetical protein
LVGVAETRNGPMKYPAWDRLPATMLVPLRPDPQMMQFFKSNLRFGTGRTGDGRPLSAHRDLGVPMGRDDATAPTIPWHGTAAPHNSARDSAPGQGGTCDEDDHSHPGGHSAMMDRSRPGHSRSALGRPAFFLVSSATSARVHGRRFSTGRARSVPGECDIASCPAVARIPDFLAHRLE